MQAQEACEGQPAAPGSPSTPEGLKSGQGEVVFWQVNNEVRIKNEELLERFMKVAEELEPLTVEERGDEFGYFVALIYAAPHPGRRHGVEVWVERRWIPAFGYSWSETKIKRIEVY
jgi:hypothetical protein